ncbi:MAG: cytochrome o ubiquinol oxidase subunit IV [Candidatus Doudnabacteria bacterium]|nr:cytochrome o ubiquinol oxidase subunit IV [Candidatus Doudnabacteria bacterium]
MKKYTLGFVLSIILTLAAYFAVVDKFLSGFNLTLLIVALALVQLCVQLYFFLHLDAEEGPRWNLSALLATAGMILILVAGSIIIMNNLKYRHNVPDTKTILENEAITK